MFKLSHECTSTINIVFFVLAISLERATEALLMNGKSPLRKVGQLDNRGSHFYLAMYWARELANQAEDTSLQSIFENVATTMETHEEKIVAELNESQGNNEDINGYYFPDEKLVNDIMRPSATLNTIIDNL